MSSLRLALKQSLQETGHLVPKERKRRRRRRLSNSSGSSSDSDSSGGSSAASSSHPSMAGPEDDESPADGLGRDAHRRVKKKHHSQREARPNNNNINNNINNNNNPTGTRTSVASNSNSQDEESENEFNSEIDHSYESEGSNHVPHRTKSRHRSRASSSPFPDTDRRSSGEDDADAEEEERRLKDDAKNHEESGPSTETGRKSPLLKTPEEQARIDKALRKKQRRMRRQESRNTAAANKIQEHWKRSRERSTSRDSATDEQGSANHVRPSDQRHNGEVAPKAESLGAPANAPDHAPQISAQKEGEEGPEISAPKAKKKKNASDDNGRSSGSAKRNKTVARPSPEVLAWARGLSERQCRKHMCSGLRVKVRFASKVKKEGKIVRKKKWYGGRVTAVSKEGSKIRIKYDDGTSEISKFPDKDIVVDDVMNGQHSSPAHKFIPPRSTEDETERDFDQPDELVAKPLQSNKPESAPNPDPSDKVKKQKDGMNTSSSSSSLRFPDPTVETSEEIVRTPTAQNDESVKGLPVPQTPTKEMGNAILQVGSLEEGELSSDASHKQRINRGSSHQNDAPREVVSHFDGQAADLPLAEEANTGEVLEPLADGGKHKSRNSSPRLSLTIRIPNVKAEGRDSASSKGEEKGRNLGSKSKVTSDAEEVEPALGTSGPSRKRSLNHPHPDGDAQPPRKRIHIKREKGANSDIRIGDSFSSDVESSLVDSNDASSLDHPDGGGDMEQNDSEAFSGTGNLKQPRESKKISLVLRRASSSEVDLDEKELRKTPTLSVKMKRKKNKDESLSPKAPRHVRKIHRMPPLAENTNEASSSPLDSAIGLNATTTDVPISINNINDAELSTGSKAKEMETSSQPSDLNLTDRNLEKKLASKQFRDKSRPLDEMSAARPSPRRPGPKTGKQDDLQMKKKKKRKKREADDDGEHSMGSQNDRQWVQCDSCGKWRILPSSVQASSLPKHWYCDMNTYDPKRSSCEAPEQTPKQILKERKRAKKRARQRLELGGEMRGDNDKKKFVDESPSTFVQKKEMDQSAVDSDGPKPKSQLVEDVKFDKKNISGKKGSLQQGADDSTVAPEMPIKVKRRRGRPSRKELDDRRGTDQTENEDTQDDTDNVEWVQCEKCEKWRKLPPHISADELPETWYCSLNTWNPDSASCDSPEDKADSQHQDVGIVGGTIPQGTPGKFSYRSLIFGNGKKTNRPMSERTRAAESLFMKPSDNTENAYPTCMYSKSSMFLPRISNFAKSQMVEEEKGPSVFDVMNDTKLWTELRGLSESADSNQGDKTDQAYRKLCIYDNLSTSMKDAAREVVLRLLGLNTLTGEDIVSLCKTTPFDDAPLSWLNVRMYCNLDVVINTLLELVKERVVEMTCDRNPNIPIGQWIPRYRVRRTRRDPHTDEAIRASRSLKISKPWRHRGCQLDEKWATKTEAA